MEENRIDWRKLGNRIAEMRMARGVTQQVLAEKIGVSVTYVGYLEQGKRHGTFDTYAQIVSVLGFTLNDLIRDELKSALRDSLAWELTAVLADCGEDEQEAIVRIVREMANMIRLFRMD